MASVGSGGDAQQAAEAAMQALQAAQASGAAQAAGRDTRENTRPEPIHVDKKPRPNDPCPCGSGKKYKQCHGKFGSAGV